MCGKHLTKFSRKYKIYVYGLRVRRRENMKPIKVLLAFLNALGLVGIIGGAFVAWLIMYTGRMEFIAFVIAAIAIGVGALVASSIINYRLNKRAREQKEGKWSTPYQPRVVNDPFSEFPDTGRRPNVDPFGFDTPCAPGTSQTAESTPAAESKDKFCQNCGAKRSPSDKFCPYCGHRYDK